ncbi:MAG: T9SS type A sorting domain-containing protein [Bacteroidota bacterium]
MKSIISLIIFSLMYSSSFSQNWESLGQGVNQPVFHLYPDSVDNLLYIGGQFKFADGITVNGVATWDGQSFTTVGSGVNNCSSEFCYQTLALTRYKDHIYCSPLSTLFGDSIINGIAKWNGTTWSNVGKGILTISGSNGVALSMLTYEEELYIFGAFHRIGQDSAFYAAKWNGDSLSSLNFFKENLVSRIHHAVVFQNEIYVAGFFEDDQGNQLDVAKYDGQHWYPVGGGIKGFADDPLELIVYNDELYTCGYFKKSSGNTGTGILKLKNNAWVDVGGSFDGDNVVVDGMIVFDEALFAFGRFSHVGGGVAANNIAKWDGERWCGLGSTFPEYRDVKAAAVYNDELYIAGSFDSIDGQVFNRIAKWTGGNYVDTCGEAVSTTYLDKISIPKFSISPNPSFEVINFEIQGKVRNDARLVLSNLLGQSLQTLQLPSFSGQYSHQLEVSTYPVGTYFLTLQIGAQVTTRKVVIQR